MARVAEAAGIRPHGRSLEEAADRLGAMDALDGLGQDRGDAAAASLPVEPQQHQVCRLICHLRSAILCAVFTPIYCCHHRVLLSRKTF